MSSTLAIAERNVPRYTSYPTAPHFSAKIGPEIYAAWLDALPAEATLSLYIHVPFCTDLCYYCGCHTRAVRKREPIDAYAERVIDEIKLFERLRGRKVKHLHWGGGTPSILGPHWLETISAKLQALFDFSELKEHAIELDPRKVDAELARALHVMGVTRASLGVQDVSPEVQKLIGREQPFDLVERAAAMLREAGIANLNVDLMYGLPGQTVREVAKSAELAASLGAQRMALFGYAHVPWFKTHQRLMKAELLPGLSERLEQAQVAAETLQGLGYQVIGLDHFALPDDELAVAARERRLRRNFQGYTTDEADALIGLGASSIGKLPQGFIQNAPDIGGHARAVQAGKFPIVKGLELADDDRLRASIIERLMCDLALDLDAFADGETGEARFAKELETLQPLAEVGLITIEGPRITVTDLGRPYIRIAAAAFDAYLPATQKRHSIAV